MILPLYREPGFLLQTIMSTWLEKTFAMDDSFDDWPQHHLWNNLVRSMHQEISNTHPALLNIKYWFAHRSLDTFFKLRMATEIPWNLMIYPHLLWEAIKQLPYTNLYITLISSWRENENSAVYQNTAEVQIKFSEICRLPWSSGYAPWTSCHCRKLNSLLF